MKKENSKKNGYMARKTNKAEVNQLKNDLKATNFEDFKDTVVELLFSGFEKQEFMIGLIAKAHRSIDKSLANHKKAVEELREMTDTLRCFALVHDVAIYSLKHTGNMSEEQRVSLLKNLGYDPELMKREHEAKQLAALNV